MSTDAHSAPDERWSWADHGNCVGNADLFYNNEGEPRSLRRRKEKQAKILCSTCPVATECGQYALRHHELYGVWGGMSEAERHRLEGRVRTG